MEESQQSLELPQLAEKFVQDITKILNTPPIPAKADKQGNVPEALKMLYIDYVTTTTNFIKQIANHQQEYTDKAPDQIKSDLKRNCVDLDNFMAYKSKNFTLTSEVQGLQYTIEQNDKYINQLLHEREKLHQQITGLYETIAQWETKFNQARSECVQQIVQIQQKQDDIKFLEKKLTTTEEESKQQIEALNDTLENLQKFNSRLQQQLKELSTAPVQNQSNSRDILASSEYRQLQEKNNELANQLSLLQQETQKQAKEDTEKVNKAQLELSQFKEQITIANLNNRETILRQNAQIAELEHKSKEMEILIAELRDDQALNTDEKVRRLRAQHNEEKLRLRQKLTASEAETLELKKKLQVARITQQELRQKIKLQDRQLEIYTKDAPPDEQLRLLEAQIQHLQKDLFYYKDQYRILYLESQIRNAPEHFKNSQPQMPTGSISDPLFFSGDGYRYQESEQYYNDAPEAVLGSSDDGNLNNIPPQSARSFAPSNASMPQSMRSGYVQESAQLGPSRLTKEQIQEIVDNDEDLYLLKLSIDHKIRENYIPPPNAGRRVKKPITHNSLRYATQLQQLSKSK